MKDFITSYSYYCSNCDIMHLTATITAAPSPIHQSTLITFIVDLYLLLHCYLYYVNYYCLCMASCTYMYRQIQFIHMLVIPAVHIFIPHFVFLSLLSYNCYYFLDTFYFLINYLPFQWWSL